MFRRFTHRHFFRWPRRHHCTCITDRTHSTHHGYSSSISNSSRITAAKAFCFFFFCFSWCRYCTRGISLLAGRSCEGSHEGEEVFSNGRRRGFRSTAEQIIDTGHARPLRCVRYRVSSFEHCVIKAKVEEILRDRMILPSFSPWALPVGLVRKNTGDYRFGVDYRRLKTITTKDLYPLPRIGDVFDRLARSKLITSIDLAN